ncbi:unnamed protein product [Dovyalis caffra]|uniref:Pectinesterase n=1 Tax=Dovyalis caffra TaxID=77055 RepID=A0AAV1SPB0_9ROSI|nr:unnamed protein product [Dovyalis caffra]
MTEASQYISISKKNKKLILAIFASFLLVATIIAIVTGVNSQKNSTKNDAAHAILETIGAVNTLTVPMNVFLLHINSTRDDAQKIMFDADKQQSTNKGLSQEQKKAFVDCSKNYARIVDDLNMLIVDPNKKAADLKTHFSSCLFNKDSCLDGFSHSYKNKEVRDAWSSDTGAVKAKCSQALGMIKDESTADMPNGLKTTNRKLKEDSDSNERWPEWLSVTDRRLFQSSRLTPDAVVAADGSGNYRTVSAAVAGAPNHSSKRYIIRIKAGLYRENVEVPIEKTNIMFLGDGRKTTIITGSRNVVDGSTTYQSATPWRAKDS